MEEWVGGLWDRFITRSARRDHPAAAVQLSDIEKTAGVLFRAMGGDAGLRVAPAVEERHGARRRWLSRIAGSDEKSAQAALDDETLRLPPSIAWFPERALNRDLYLWLIAQAAHDAVATSTDWIVRNQQATQAALARYPGLNVRYQRLVTAHLAERMTAPGLPAEEAAQEQAICQALQTPGSVSSLPAVSKPKPQPLQPVPLWLYPAPEALASSVRRRDPAQHEGSSAKEEQAEKKQHAAERVAAPDNVSPLIMMFRAESIFSWGEFVKLNRALDDDANPDAGRAAENMDKLAIADDDNQRVASKVRFDLDLPPSGVDDVLLGEGIPFPEWDYRKHELKRDWCRLQLMTARHVEALPLPERLRRPARKLRSQFAALAPARRWFKGQTEGTELDLDACLRLQTDRLAGWHTSGAGAYLDQRQSERDLACLVLADLSLSTDAYVSDEHRVIDVIRDSLLLFGEALTATGDRFGMYGFSSLKRSHVRFHVLKEFAASLDSEARGRITAIKPGYYTRMGTAIRQSVKVLAKQPQATRLLLLLSDGKPHDIDNYEGRYGIEDTRMSLIEARRAGVRPFCVTIDREGASYLPHLFGPDGFTVIRKPEELPARLPLLYAQLTT
jgi:nitric oxide reductase NorD protein